MKTNTTNTTNKNMKPSKPTKPAKPAKTAKKAPGKTRAEVRQAILVAKTLTEAERVEREAGELFDRLFALNSKAMTPIDRHLLTLQLHAMEAYASTLRTIYAFERVRTRRRNGESLRKGKDELLRFLYGAFSAYETGCSFCLKDCHGKEGCCHSEKARADSPSAK